MIETKNLTKTYKNYNAVDSANIKIKDNRIYGLVGKNGAGKTTLIRMIAGLIYPSSGEIIINGKSDTFGLINERKKMSFIVETPYFRPDFTAMENMELHRISQGIRDDGKLSKKWLDFVELGDTEKKKAGDFSLGMRQRLGIAMSMISQPHTLFLDEPINGLDPVGIIQMRELIGKLNKDYGATVVISSHILSELYQVATDYIFINKGHIIEQISKHEIDECCSDHLIVGTKMINEAEKVIRSFMNIKDYSINHLKSEIIINEGVETEVVAKTMINNGVSINKLLRKSTTLEEYFLSIVNEGGNL